MVSEFCKIVLDKSENTYLPGQILSGTVEIAIQKPKKIRGIIVHYRGSADTSWTESTYDSDSPGNSRDITYKGEEIYFDTQYYVTGGRNHETFTLAAGVHIYSFSYALPTNLPSTFEGNAGNIGYFVEVVLDRPWKKNQSTKQEVIVTSPFDLNLFPKLKAPNQTVVEKHFCSWCCKSAPLTVTMTAPKAGYVCGEVMDVVIDFDNASGVGLRKITLKFQQLTTFKATYLSTNHKEIAEVYEEIPLGQLESRASKTWRRSFAIPTLRHSSPYESGIIQSQYEIQMEIVPRGLHKDIKASLPFKIGSIGFNGINVLPPDYGTSQNMVEKPI